MVARFGTGGRTSLTSYRRLCMSKPNAYGERGTSKPESDSKSRSLQTCKHLEGTLEGADDSKISQSQQAALLAHPGAHSDSTHTYEVCKYPPRSVERVEGNYHEEQRLEYKLAPAKGRKAFKAKCELLHTCSAKPRPCAARACSVHKCAGLQTAQVLRCAQGSARRRPSMAMRVLTRLCLHTSECARPAASKAGPEIGQQAQREGAEHLNGSHIMTLSQPQLKVASVSSTRYGLTKLAELKRHRDGKYRHIIEIIADPLVLLAAYGHLNMKYRTPGEFERGKSLVHQVRAQAAKGAVPRRSLCDDELRALALGPLESIEREWFDFAAKRLIEGNYECKPARRVVIPKPKNAVCKHRGGCADARASRKPPYDRISVVSPRDQIVQEVVRIVLSYIYDGSEVCKHQGFRQSSGGHRALREIRRTWNGVSWFLEFNLRKRDDTISRRILVNILREDIQDQRFFNLIHKMFNTNTVNVLPSNQASLPQGSRLSPLLCDLYLSKLDKEVQRIQVEYNSSQRKRRENPVFKNLTRVTLDEKIQLEFNRDKIRRLLKNRIRRAYQKGISKTDYNDPNFVRIFYVRYADDFLFGVIGSKILVKKIQNRVSQFLKSSLQLEVSKTTIIHSTAGMVNFLGMNIRCIPPKYCALRRSSESLKRIRLRLKTQSLLRQKAWEASIRRIAFKKWAEAFETTCKLLSSTTLAKRAAFSNAFGLAQRLTGELSGPCHPGAASASSTPVCKQLDECEPRLPVSQLLKAEKELFSSTIWNELPKDIKRKHVELISLLDDHSCKIGLKFGLMKQLTSCAGSTSKYSPKTPRLLAPIDHIRDQLRRRGIVENTNFRPTPLNRMLNHEDSIIVNYFRAIANGVLSYYRCCDNFNKVKRIVNYQIRWAALHTLANKHKLTVNNAIDCYTLDLIIKQEVNGQVIIVAKFPSKNEIANMRKKFLVNAEIPRYSSPHRP